MPEWSPEACPDRAPLYSLHGQGQRRGVVGSAGCALPRARHAACSCYRGRQRMVLNITRPKLDQDMTAELADTLERVAREALGEALADDACVRFGTWRSETGALQLLCKVEATGDPFLPGWRWWSRLCDSPEDLREALVEVA